MDLRFISRVKVEPNTATTTRVQKMDCSAVYSRIWTHLFEACLLGTATTIHDHRHHLATIKHPS
eukprot:scaffold12302_cov76-Amphora_coffeaeformis.AAC.1